MSANAGTPRRLSAIPATVCRKRTPPEVCRACQRFGSCHHRNAAPDSPPSNAATVGRKFAAPVSGQPFDRVPPVSGSEVPASRAAGFRQTSNAGKPSGFRSKAATVRHHRTRATYPATVRQSQCLIAETETETESRRPRVCGRGRVCAFRLRLVILYSFFFFLWIAHAMLMQCLCIAYAYRAAPDSARAVRALAATIAGNAA